MTQVTLSGNKTYKQFISLIDKAVDQQSPDYMALISDDLKLLRKNKEIENSRSAGNHKEILFIYLQDAYPNELSHEVNIVWDTSFFLGEKNARRLMKYAQGKGFQSFIINEKGVEE